MTLRPLALLPILLVALLSSVIAPPARAATVSYDLHPQRTEVGLPVRFSVRVEDAQQHDPPRPPVVDGATVRSLGSSQSITASIINGQAKQTAVTTYQYLITPQREGELVIPSIRILADGQSFTTPELTFTVEPRATVPEAVAADDSLLQLEVLADRERVYLGERVNVTLRIWIKPYKDTQYRVVPEASSMWGMIDLARSRWGVFEPALRALAERRVQPTGRRATAPGGAAEDEEYFLYELDTAIWPVRSGTLDIGDVSIQMEYPTRLEMVRTFFDRELRVADSVTVTATVPGVPVTVEPLPTEGMPPSFRGAVGDFVIGATVEPTEAAVGEPMTLTLTVTDHTPGGADLSALAAPPLAIDPELTDRFKVSSEPIAGQVRGRTKVFRQTIRPLRADVTEVPSITFSAFNPARGAYTISRTKPVPITVTGSDRLAVTDVVGAGAPAAERATELEEVKGGILANYAIQAQTLREDGVRFGPATITAAAVPPLAYLFLLFAQWRRERHRRDPALARRSVARRLALERLQRANDASAVRAAVTQYVADALARPPGAVTRAEALVAVEEAGLDSVLRQDLSELLHACERAEYAGDGAEGHALRDRARAWIEVARLERRRPAARAEVTA